ncbi:hypothetical protein V1264_009192 [Littorina saxatilis]|uniref:CAP N-terminal domain-containing protein n=2 Tax=Littorina saxatilis TaxID=31220 RepID=A0AAN9AR13_9CAEN
MLCCCRDQLDITDDSPPKISDTDKEKVFSEAVTAHPSPAASPVTQQPANKTVASELQPSVVQATTKPAEKAPRIEETLSQTAAKSVEAATTKAAGKPPIIQETISQTAAKSVDTAPTPNPKVSVINVAASEVKKQVSAKADGVVASAVATKDNAVLAQIDSLSQAVEKSAAAGKLKGRESCSAFASQLSVLTSQVRAQAGNMSEAALQSAVARLESVASRLENLALKSGTSGASGDSGVVAPFVTAFDDVLSGNLAKFLSLSAAIGGDVKTQADLVDGAFKAEREFLANASRSKQPSPDALGKIVTPVAQKLSAAQEFRENNRRSEFFNHLSAISESIAALGWITVTPAPCPFVKEMKDAGMFYTNRVLKDYKEK